MNREDKIQMRWNRYVDAINFCIEYGFKHELFYLDTIDHKDRNGEWDGGVTAIRVMTYDNSKEGIIYLKPKKYKSMEMLRMILEKLKL